MSIVFTALLFSLGLQSTPQQQKQAPAQTTPIVVIGCLESANVNGQEQFTLVTRDTNRAQADVKTVTYQLMPTSSADLKSKIGQRVEVTGTASRTGLEQTESDTTKTTEKPAGTSGKTPTVQTRERADIVLRQLNVTSVKTVAGDCRVP